MAITRVGILGAGTMGRQLALMFASNNIPVNLWNHRCQPNFQAEFCRLALIQSKLGLLVKYKIPEILEKVNYRINCLRCPGVN